MKSYSPSPIDTSDVKLPDELLPLAEQIAKNVHEVWALGRQNDGWTWGPERNDSLKQHPSIIPCEQLSEQEKDYDRRTSQQTLKLILKLGFHITL